MLWLRMERPGPQESVNGVPVLRLVGRLVGQAGMGEEQAEALVERKAAVAPRRALGKGLQSPVIRDVPAGFGGKLTVNKTIPFQCDIDRFGDLEKKRGHLLAVLDADP
jgi:hypothetical protein